MPIRADDMGADPEFERFDGGLSWIAHPEEGMQRASHALETEDGLWLVDPLDVPGLDDKLAEIGSVAGVVLLLDRHERDAPQIARRHDVPVTRAPGIDRSVDARTEDVSGRLPGTEFEFRTLLDWPGWHEEGLWDGSTLVVPESLGTVSYTTVGAEPLGVNPIVRIAPPRQLADLAPERVLVGHGSPVLDDATVALRDALATARRRLPQAWIGALRAMF